MLHRPDALQLLDELLIVPDELKSHRVNPHREAREANQQITEPLCGIPTRQRQRSRLDDLFLGGLGLYADNFHAPLQAKPVPLPWRPEIRILPLLLWRRSGRGGFPLKSSRFSTQPRIRATAKRARF